MEEKIVKLTQIHDLPPVDFDYFIAADLGHTEIASLIARGPGKVDLLKYGCDGCKMAYIITDGNIPNTFKLAFSCCHWLQIYDDKECVFEMYGDLFNIYMDENDDTIIEVK